MPIPICPFFRNPKRRRFRRPNPKIVAESLGFARRDKGEGDDSI